MGPNGADSPATAPEKQAWVYLLRCKNGSLYAGWTDDLPHRMAAHRSGKGGAKYTRGFGAQQLCYACQMPDKSAALREEAALKKRTKAQKEALCAAWQAAHTLRLGLGGPADAPRMRELFCWYVAHSTASYAWDAPTPEQYAATLASALATGPCVLAQGPQGQLLGYAYAHPWRSREAYAWDVETTIYLAQDARGMGFGARLYSALLALLKEQGYYNAYGILTDPNPGSEALHAALGFVCEGRNKRAGYKQGRWLGLSSWVARLTRGTAQPAPVQTPDALDPARVEAILRGAEQGRRWDTL